MNFISVIRMAIEGILPAFIIMILVYLLCRIVWKRSLSRYDNGFVFYMAILLYVTLFRYQIRSDALFEITNQNINLIPFVELLSIWENDISVFIYNVLGNILWFIPFGLFMKKLTKYSSIKIILIALILSTSIEFLQFILHVGTCDIDDIILNTIGSVVGVISFIIMKRVK